MPLQPTHQLTHVDGFNAAQDEEEDEEEEEEEEKGKGLALPVGRSADGS